MVQAHHGLPQTLAAYRLVATIFVAKGSEHFPLPDRCQILLAVVLNVSRIRAVFAYRGISLAGWLSSDAHCARRIPHAIEAAQTVGDRACDVNPFSPASAGTSLETGAIAARVRI